MPIFRKKKNIKLDICNLSDAGAPSSCMLWLQLFSILPFLPQFEVKHAAMAIYSYSQTCVFSPQYSLHSQTKLYSCNMQETRPLQQQKLLQVLLQVDGERAREIGKKLAYLKRRKVSMAGKKGRLRRKRERGRKSRKVFVSSFFPCFFLQWGHRGSKINWFCLLRMNSL